MNNKARKILAIITVIALVGWLVSQALGPGKPQRSRPVKTQAVEPTFRHDGNGMLLSAAGDTLVSLQLEFAKTDNEIQYGMMYRSQMDKQTGMLFFMKTMRPQSFWMKNTLVPLDIIYIDDQLKIVSIQKNAVPKSMQSLPSEGPAMYVLEVYGGQSDVWGLSAGDQLVLVGE
ncbi:MAG: hypothetical protein SchgKO_14690 [Schleiferiaceae bacterium]